MDSPKPSGKPIICLDFDGCIHSYKSGWKGVSVIEDPPVPGVFEWIETALEHFSIYVYSSRSSTAAGRRAMFQYIQKYADNLSGRLIFSDTKPRAWITIDDRCVCFEGRWGDPQYNPRNLLTFAPWYKR